MNSDVFGFRAQRQTADYAALERDGTTIRRMTAPARLGA
jgi:hypothetical protein